MGRKMFLVTSRNIKRGEQEQKSWEESCRLCPGEEITDNYCAVYSELGVSARRQFLQVRGTCCSGSRDVYYFVEGSFL